MSHVLTALALAALLPLAAPSARAQDGWDPNWTQVDQDGNTVQPYPNGFLFLGTLTGNANVTGNYQAMTDWFNADPGDRALAYSPTPNRPGQPPAFLFGGPDLLDHYGLTISAAAFNYYSLGYASHSATFGDPDNGIPLQDVTGGISVHETCPLKLRLKWDPEPQDGIDPVANPAPPAPDHVNLLVTSSVSAGVSLGNAPTIPGSFTGVGGRAATVTVTEIKFGGTVTASVSDADPNSASSHPPDVTGTHLLRVPVQSGIAEVVMDAVGDAQASAPKTVGDDINCSFAGAYGDVSACANFDDREVTLHRDGAHNETVDPDGTVHGDTTYSYVDTEPGYDQNGHRSDQDTPQPNWQTFEPSFGGSWSQILTLTGSNPDVGWNWSPNDSRDNWDIGFWEMPYGKMDVKYGTWIGTPTGPRGPMTITYTATDNNDGSTATATYKLTVHDQYEKWRRIDGLGNSMEDQNAPGDLGKLVSVGSNTTAMPGTPVLSIQGEGVNWNVVGTDGGGVLQGAGNIVSLFSDVVPTWVGVALNLAGLTAQAVGSTEPTATNISPPDQTNASLMQTGYENYVNNQNCPLEDTVTNNLVDANLASLLAVNPDFLACFDGRYGTITLTTTLSVQMLNYYLSAYEYDTGGLVTQDARSTVTKPGGNVWTYLWHCAGGGVITPYPPIKYNPPTE